MKNLKFNLIVFLVTIITACSTSNRDEKKQNSLLIEGQNLSINPSVAVVDPTEVFNNPPESAKPRVMWMWMGCNISQTGITRDLEALRDAGFGGTMMFSLTDVGQNWCSDIGKSPTPEIITWTEPWWKMVRYAAMESQRLGLTFSIHNCAGYGTSGGKWITPELSMQQICWSKTPVSGSRHISMQIARPQVDSRALMLWPIFNSDLGKMEKPENTARKTYYRDVAVLALPAKGTVARTQIIDLSDKLDLEGLLDWEVPAGQWIIYRFGHTTMGGMQYPAQWKANGLECDKMNPEAVAFHINHVVGDIKKHLGDLPGYGLDRIHFDSYEAGPAKWTPDFPCWTPKMGEEFLKRRGYNLTPFLPVLANRKIDSDQETDRFRADFEITINDLHRDSYFATLSGILRQAGLVFSCEPYTGPWKIPEVTPYIHSVVAEFWSDSGYRPYKTGLTIAAAHQNGQNIIEAEAFTSVPEHSRWNEYPGMLKSVGDVAFCEGINRFVVHRFVHQPWDKRYRPGVSMGQWGTHFDRTQTWWEPSKALVHYWQRCQALLQWGKFTNDPDAFKVLPQSEGKTASLKPQLRFIQRSSESADIFFVANTDRAGSCRVTASFSASGKQPELWDPVTGVRRDLPEFEQREGRTLVPLEFAPEQSWFVVFRKSAAETSSSKKSGKNMKNFHKLSQVAEIDGSWQVSFDPQWGGPTQPVTFARLEDWIKRPEPGIRYYSGTAVYRKQFDVLTSALGNSESRMFLDLGKVRHIARVRLNGHDLGVVWTAPWRVDISDVVREKANRLEIEITNVWANRLIGDEKEPADCVSYSEVHNGTPLKEFPDWFLKNEPRPSQKRYCFTTWNYFTKDDSPLVSSGLLGPVRIVKE